MPSLPTRREAQTPKPGPLIEEMLDPDEWDFRDIAEKWELPYAVIYEYARSSEYRGALTEWFQKLCGDCMPPLVIAEHADVLRACGFRGKLPRKITIGELIERIYDHASDDGVIRRALHLIAQNTPPVFHQEKLLCLALRFPQFPEPWILVRRAKGAAYLQKRCFKWTSDYPPLVELGDDTDTAQHPLYALYASARPANIGKHTFEIDWSASVPKIKNSFSEWLSRHHPYGAGRPNIAEPLKWLGAYRIMDLKKFSHTQALSAVKTYLDSHRRGAEFGCHPKYENVNKWIEAVDKARSLLEGSFAVELAKRSNQLWLV